MKNKDFDNIDKLAQEAFENFEVEFDPMDWADLQNKLRTESSIDQVAKDALEDYEVPFDKNDWIRLEKQLDKERDLLPHIWWLKSTEVGVMALLLFTLFNLNSNQTPHTHSNQNYDQTTTLTPSADLDNATTNKDQNSTFQMPEKDASTLSNDINAPQAFHESATTTVGKASSDNFSDNSSNNNPSFDTPSLAATKTKESNLSRATNVVTDDNQTSSVVTTASNSNEVPNQTNNNGSTGEDGTANTLNATTNHDVTNKLTGIENTTKRNETEKETNRSRFSILQIPTLDVKGGIKTTDPIFELKKAKLELPFKGKSYIGAVARIGSNFATSMGGTSVGYGAGLTFTNELSRKFALKTGAMVAYNKYDVNEVLLIDNKLIDGRVYEIDQSKTSHLVILEVPVDVQYTFFQSEKWKIYATAGIVANVISSRTYTGSQTSNANGISLKEDLNSNNFDRGAFEGGLINQNAFLSVGGGLGLERQLGDKISLYILPSYRHAVTPSGANKDYISSFSVNIGIKTAL
ncbi:outer membrane beta-barrel protein [Aureispira sp. CCB-E]|uniref:outer membrane beta-barrel protein n=1 Tax=Aureispira sp. CCB-E TaxID=3051121 RepID=UPI0028688DC3|nr:outer membrane beta-barrel protein [Aureispira sp. CCB-E]WMX16380.1 outer membrane beta-barrel protein [Aureispira sp. CCB-E]